MLQGLAKRNYIFRYQGLQITDFRGKDERQSSFSGSNSPKQKKTVNISKETVRIRFNVLKSTTYIISSEYAGLKTTHRITHFFMRFIAYFGVSGKKKSLTFL